MELILLLFLLLTWILVWMNYFLFDKRIKQLWETFDLANETTKDILEFDRRILQLSEAMDKRNKHILDSVPDSMKNLEDTKQVLDLAKQQQMQIAKIRQDWFQANMYLMEVAGAVSRSGGDLKPDEALLYLRKTKEKYGDDFGKIPKGLEAEVSIEDSHTDRKETP